MSRKTDADWQVLDHRIARKVMGWFKWDELPEILRLIFWKVIETQPDEYDLAFNRDKWWSVLESGCPDSEEDIVGWQPHNDVAQAVLARDRIVEQGWDFVLGASVSGQCEVLVVASFVPEAGVGMFESERSAATDGKAICLAIGRWLDAQKDKQNEPK